MVKKARLNIFSKSHSHWSHLSQCISLKSWAISSTDFPLAVFSHQSQIQFEWLLSFFLDTRERWSQGDPWQQCIYLRVCLFVKKKCPSLPGFLTSDTPLVSHSRMAIMLELKTLEILVLSILVSANSSRLVNRLKLVLSPNPRRYYHRLGSSNIHNFDSYSHISKPLDVRPSSQFAWNALIFDSCAWYWWPFLLKCVCLSTVHRNGQYQTLDVNLL